MRARLLAHPNTDFLHTNNPNFLRQMPVGKVLSSLENQKLYMNLEINDN